ncbi:hypothetical protein Agub_g15233 [Astrephomene gubernaculifera]|uniref:Uncharacterized protein n=1 Tax=Astrephomene gubernaculifera TaxID=47775 RepID=A0AAD3HTU0_9CHLO|nr:hypothetical protein Agub_g15233 [Astrephomene gubernaculifera]
MTIKISLAWKQRLLVTVGLFCLHTLGCIARGLDCDRPEPAKRLYVYGNFNYTHRIRTTHPEAQSLFDQAMLLTADFNQPEARASLRAALSYDPDCVMCWWGLAHARGPFQNKPAVAPPSGPSAPAFPRYTRQDRLEALAAITTALRLLGLSELSGRHHEPAASPPSPPGPAGPAPAAAAAEEPGGAHQPSASSSSQSPGSPSGGGEGGNRTAGVQETGGSRSGGGSKEAGEAAAAPAVSGGSGGGSGGGRRLVERLGLLRHCAATAGGQQSQHASSHGRRHMTAAAAAAGDAASSVGGDEGDGGGGSLAARERRYVAAMADRLSVAAEWGSEWEAAERRYAQDMADIAACWPGDADAPALAAEALANTRPWDFWDPITGEPREVTPLVLQLINMSLTRDPLQPLALHLHIHTTEQLPAGRGADRAGLAESSADRLSVLFPAFDHLTHMASHTFVRVGRWKEAAESNFAALRASVRGSHMCLASLYPDHNTALGVFAASMGADARRAEVYARVLKELPRFVRDAPASLGSQWSAPLLVWVRFAAWKKVLAAPPPPHPVPPSSPPSLLLPASPGLTTNNTAAPQQPLQTTAKPPSRTAAAAAAGQTVVVVRPSRPEGNKARETRKTPRTLIIRGMQHQQQPHSTATHGSAVATEQHATEANAEAEAADVTAGYPNLDLVLGNGSSSSTNSRHTDWRPLRGPLLDTEYTPDGAEYARVLWHFARLMALAAQLTEATEAATEPAANLTSPLLAAAAVTRKALPYKKSRPYGPQRMSVVASAATSAAAAEVAAEVAAASRRELAAEFGALRAAEAEVPPDVAVPPGQGLGIDVPGYKLLSAVLGLTAEARLAVLEGDLGAAAEALSRAVDVEASGGYYEPPRLGPQPARQCLGWVLLRAGRLREALQTYLDDLSHFPDNPWSIRGLHAALPPAMEELEREQRQLDEAVAAAAAAGAAGAATARAGAGESAPASTAAAAREKRTAGGDDPAAATAATAAAAAAAEAAALRLRQAEVRRLRATLQDANAAVEAASKATLEAANALRSSCLAFSERK